MLKTKEEGELIMTRKFRLLHLLTALMFLGFSQMVFAVPGGCPVEGSLPMNIGPINPVNGFPLYVQDSNGLAVEFCPDINDPNTNPGGVCIGDPVDPANPFSAQIGFGAEGFMASAEAAIDVGDPGTGVGISALLVSGVELAFLTETPADGDQFPFTRLRLRLDVPQPGIYTVTHPWGEEVFLVSAVGVGQEVRESFDIQFFADTVHQGRIGPILTWDTFNLATGTLTDSPLVGFIGDLGVGHTVTGSPCGTNFFSVKAVALDGTTPINIDGAGGNVVTTDLFAVTGKVFTGVVPAPLVANRTTYTRQNPGGQVDIFATSAPTAGVTVSGTANLPEGERPLLGDGTGTFFTSIPLANASILPATVNVTANNGSNDPNTQISLLTDFVNISVAEYDTATSTLTIQATSSDGLVPQTLTAFGYGNLTGGTLAAITPAPPAMVTVTSSAGGVDSKVVAVRKHDVNGANPVAVDDNFITTEDTPLVVAAPGILGNDTDDEDTQPVNAVLGVNATNGNVILNIDGGFTYTPALDFTGGDSFTYAARDSDNNLSNLATVTITVGAANDAPTAGNDTAATDINTSVVIEVLANDTDTDGGINPATVAVTSPSANGGAVTADGSGFVTYVPAPDFVGVDTFTYTVADGLGAISNTATVTVTVNNVVAEVITVIRAEFRASRNEWRVTGVSSVSAPNSMNIFVGPSATGVQLGLAGVDALGTWAFRERNSATLPNGATTITVQSAGGATVTVPLQNR